MTRGKSLSFDRKEALQRAMELFWTRGYEATGMTELLEHMGIQRQSFYNTFGSKEEILLETIQMYAEGARKRFRDALDEAETPFERLDRLFALWSEMGEEHPDAGCFIGNCTAEFGHSNAKVKVIMDQNVKALRDLFKTIFVEAIERGDLPPDRDPDVLTSTLFTYGQGLALMSKGPTHSSEFPAIMDIMKASLKR